MVWLVVLAIWGLAVTPVSAAEPPDLIRVVNDSTIKQGFEKMFKVELVGYVAGGTFMVSGDGVALITPHGGIKPAAEPNHWRIKFAAAADATPGLRDLTYLGPDGQTDTLVDAIEVFSVAVIPDTGVAGHVFSDADGNGIKDGTDSGLPGVMIQVIAGDGAVSTASTDAGGNYTVTDLVPGQATVTYSTPSGATLTTANEGQTLTIVDQAVTSASAVGYQGAVGGTVDISSISSSTIEQGNRGFYIVFVTGADLGATWSFSGSGLSIIKVVHSTDRVRIAVVASADADLGPHDLTVVNLGGASDTLVGALTVTP